MGILFLLDIFDKIGIAFISGVHPKLFICTIPSNPSLDSFSVKITLSVASAPKWYFNNFLPYLKSFFKLCFFNLLWDNLYDFY